MLAEMFGKDYEYCGNGEVWLGGRNPDIINVNGQKKCIEVNGEFWHGPKKKGCPRDQHEREQIEHYRKYGFDCLVVWEHELKNESALKTKLEAFHHG